MSLCLFWAWSALDAGLSDKDRDRTWEALLTCVRKAWATELGLPLQDLDAYSPELTARQRLYERMTREGADPAAVAATAANLLETESVIEPDDRPKLLALMVDLVPADELGEAVEAMEISD